MAGKDGDRRGWIRHGGIGFEFVAAVVGFSLVGLWIDRHYDSRPWGLVVGAALGLIGGTYNLIRGSMAAFRKPDNPADEEERRSRR